MLSRRIEGGNLRPKRRTTGQGGYRWPHQTPALLLATKEGRHGVGVGAESNDDALPPTPWAGDVATKLGTTGEWCQLCSATLPSATKPLRHPSPLVIKTSTQNDEMMFDSAHNGCSCAQRHSLRVLCGACRLLKRRRVPRQHRPESLHWHLQQTPGRHIACCGRNGALDTCSTVVLSPPVLDLEAVVDASAAEPDSRISMDPLFNLFHLTNLCPRGGLESCHCHRLPVMHAVIEEQSAGKGFEEWGAAEEPAASQSSGW
ncbi:hypothetical protein B0T21DRAFT_347473 [Apiosordaria backusii]|uniref:Uncharacterized protein n=1 Tax=Apiosordaria backusii TaxID=314023 RepID=A0AA40BMQ0_9PEZI|nr:hypothetical protein B0T21DRAFT_347473 [Apiosordaria backusii]